jgi:hypothetical protein
VEYWLPIQLDAIVDEPLEHYLTALYIKRQEEPVGIAPMIAQFLVGHEIEYVSKMRYLQNTLRVWLTPKVCWDAGYRPLADAVAPKDRWTSSGCLEAIAYRPVRNALATTYAAPPFICELKMIRTTNAEVRGVQLHLLLQTANDPYNLAHSIVVDLPLYAPSRPIDGSIVDDKPPMPGGLSMRLYVIGQHLTQIHMRLSHANKMMGKFNCTPVAGFAIPVPSSPNR